MMTTYELVAGLILMSAGVVFLFLLSGIWCNNHRRGPTALQKMGVFAFGEYRRAVITTETLVIISLFGACLPLLSGSVSNPETYLVVYALTAISLPLMILVVVHLRFHKLRNQEIDAGAILLDLLEFNYRESDDFERYIMGIFERFEGETQGAGLLEYRSAKRLLLERSDPLAITFREMLSRWDALHGIASSN
jgi:hypothetical protein